MNATIARTYQKERARGIGARYALDIARAVTKHRANALDWDNDRATWEQDGFTLTARRVPDDDADLSFYGTLEHDRSTGRDVFTPGYDSYYADARSSGMSKSAARDYEREHNAKDRQRIEDYGNGWAMQGVVVTAYRAGIELGDASLWGIESDSGDDYFDETARELASEAIDEARKALTRLGVK